MVEQVQADEVCYSCWWQSVRRFNNTKLVTLVTKLAHKCFYLNLFSLPRFHNRTVLIFQYVQQWSVIFENKDIVIRKMFVYFDRSTLLNSSVNIELCCFLVCIRSIDRFGFFIKEDAFQTTFGTKSTKTCCFFHFAITQSPSIITSWTRRMQMGRLKNPMLASETHIADQIESASDTDLIIII